MSEIPAPRLAFLANDTPAARAALAECVARYGQTDPARADVLVTLGGDGFLLETFHGENGRCVPIYGMNRGSYGFLLNPYRPDGLVERIARAQAVPLRPLAMRAETVAGATHHAFALNEVSLFRERHQAAKLAIWVDGVERLSELVCDGVLVATPAGSTAYNFSAHGPILPLGANVLALTPISAFRPRRWRGAVLPHGAEIVVEVRTAEHRPVAAVADSTEVRNVARVSVAEAPEAEQTLLFDPDEKLDERIIKEQFLP